MTIDIQRYPKPTPIRRIVIESDGFSKRTLSIKPAAGVGFLISMQFSGDGEEVGKHDAHSPKSLALTMTTARTLGHALLEITKEDSNG